LVGEQTRFLLTELVRFEAAAAVRRRHVIVAARWAWPEYQGHATYVASPTARSGGLTHFGFYADGQIQPLIRGSGSRDRGSVTDAEVARRQQLGETRTAELIRLLLADGSRRRRGSRRHPAQRPRRRGDVRLPHPSGTTR
jgi:hypothetical protein